MRNWEMRAREGNSDGEMGVGGGRVKVCKGRFEGCEVEEDL